MFERLTDTSRRAVAIANQETHRLGGTVIGDVELLLGIVSMPNCTGAVVLRKLGVSLPKLRSELERQPRVSDDGSAPAKLPQTVQFKRAIETAIALAGELGHGHVGTEHMVLGLLRHSDMAASQVLSRHAVSFDNLRQAILTAITGVGAEREP